MTSVNLTTMQSETPSAAIKSSPSSEASHVQPTKILAYFSTDAGKHEPRPASFPRDPVIVRSNFKKDVQDYCTRLRTEHPKACYSIFSGFDVRWYFDEYDFERQGGLFLYTVLTTLMEENGKRVVSFCQDFAENNRSTFPDWAERALAPKQLFHERDYEEFGPQFLHYARQCILESYERAREERLMTVNRSIAAHGVPFQAQESSIAGAYTANGRPIPPGVYVQPGHPFTTGQQHPKKGSMKAKGKNGSRFNQSPPEQQSMPTVIYDTVHGPLVAVPDGVPVPPGLRPVQLVHHHAGHPATIVQMRPSTDFAPGFRGQGGSLADPRAVVRQDQERWHGQEPPPRPYSNESVRGRRNSGSRGGTYKSNYGNNSIRRSSVGQGSDDGQSAFDNGSRFNQGEVTWRRGRIFEREVQEIPPGMDNFHFMMQQNQHTSGAASDLTDVSVAPASAYAQESREPLVRLHSGSGTGTQPAGFQNLPNKGHAGNSYQQQHQVRLPTVLPREQQVDIYFVGEDREDICDVYVGNIPRTTSEAALKTVFEQVVAVQQVKIRRSDTGMFDCGFVKFFSTSDLRKVLPPTKLSCDDQELDVRVSRNHLTYPRPAKQRSPVETKNQLGYSPAQAILLNAERQHAQQERSAKYSPQDVRSTMSDVPKVDLDLDATTWNDVVLRARDVSDAIDSEATRPEDTTNLLHKENLNPATNLEPASGFPEVSSTQILSRRKKDNGDISRLPVNLVKGLSSIGEADEPPEVENASKTTAQSAEMTRINTDERDAQGRSDISMHHGATEVRTGTEDESQLAEIVHRRSEFESPDSVKQVLEESKETASLNIVANTAEGLEAPTPPKHDTGAVLKNEERDPTIANQAVPQDILAADESSKMKSQTHENESLKARLPATISRSGDELAATDTKLAELTLSDGKTTTVNRDAPELNVTTDSFEARKKSIVSATTMTPADSAYTEGFPTPTTPSSSGAFGSQTSVKDQNAIVDLAPLYKDIARAQKLHAELDDDKMAGKMSKDLQACKEKLDELVEKIEAITAAKGEGKNKATVTKKLNKKAKVVRDAHEKLVEQVAFLFTYKKKEVSKEVKELKKDEEVAKGTQRLLKEQAILKASEKKLSEIVKKSKQEVNKSGYPQADPGASSMKLELDDKPAYPKADPGASSMKLNPTSSTFRPGTRPPVFAASDLMFDDDPTIDDTSNRVAAAHKAFAQTKADGTAPIGQIWPSFEQFLAVDLTQGLERFPRRAPMSHRTEMDILRDEVQVPQYRHREAGTHAVSGDGLGITLPGMPGYVESRPTSPDDTVSRTTSPSLTPGFQAPFSYASAASKGNLTEMNAADRAKLKGKGKASPGASMTDENTSTGAPSADKTNQGDAVKNEDDWKAPVEWGEEGYRPKRKTGKGKSATYGVDGVEIQKGG